MDPTVLGIIKDASNIVFFMSMASVAILSYIQAKKTLFSPIRTETFKLQLKTFEEILTIFQDKTESNIIDMLDLKHTLELNSLKMMLNYTDLFFPGEKIWNMKNVEKDLSTLVYGISTIEYLKNTHQLVGEAPIDDKAEQKPDFIINPAIILKKWNDYEHGMIEYTVKFQNHIIETEKLIASPILPNELKNLLIVHKKVCLKNIEQIGLTLTECAKELPNHVVTPEKAKDFSIDWIWNQFLRKRDHIEQSTIEIKLYIAKYLNIDNLMNV